MVAQINIAHIGIALSSGIACSAFVAPFRELCSVTWLLRITLRRIFGTYGPLESIQILVNIVRSTLIICMFMQHLN